MSVIVQHQLSNGSWVDCADRAEDFLTHAVTEAARLVAFRAKHNIATRHGEPDFSAIIDAKTALAVLQTVSELKTGTDWYSAIRVKPAPRPAPAIDPRPVLRCKSCGQTGHRGAYPFSTLPDSGRCDDCV
jgi:hypothetical protein